MSSKPLQSVHQAALDCLMESQVAQKIAYVDDLLAGWRAGRLSRAPATPVRELADPGRPARPVLVSPRDLPRRGLSTPGGRAAFVHAIAHIEFNAINLALDAVYRFQELPEAYYSDWLIVAEDEARHFGWLRGRLLDMGFDYGDFPAHDGLWTAARRTAHDPMVRMALVPRVLEARGLDVTPGMIERLESVGDSASAAILRDIWREEIAHVEAGSRWFRHLAQERGLEPEATFIHLLDEYGMDGVRGGLLHRQARTEAGFAASELDFLAGRR